MKEIRNSPRAGFTTFQLEGGERGLLLEQLPELRNTLNFQTNETFVLTRGINYKKILELASKNNFIVETRNRL